ncbi:MAG: serine/threonine protein kinase [Deltaproteobacteria bacterium]|nr:serine/threonine protein kinase [Deltaproteobacteria bacterium]
MTPAEGESQRICPLCDAPCAEQFCPIHEVPVVDLALFGSKGSRVAVRAILGGKYRLDKALGEGAFGSVFEGTQLGLGRKVAVKLLSDADDEATREIVRRFYTEAKNLAQLHHPNLVSILDFGLDEKTHALFLVMELVEGRPLGWFIERGRVDERVALRLVRELARGLSEAHGKGLVHRDLKPANIMIGVRSDGGDMLKIVDFGLSTLARADEARFAKITKTGITVGTVNYMSPELVQGSRVDARSDLYAVGCILFEMLSGHAPFRSKNVAEVAIAQAIKNPPMHELSDVSEPVTALVSRLLQKDRDLRVQSANELAELSDRLIARLGAGPPLSIDDNSPTVRVDEAAEFADPASRMSVRAVSDAKAALRATDSGESAATEEVADTVISMSTVAVADVARRPSADDRAGSYREQLVWVAVGAGVVLLLVTLAMGFLAPPPSSVEAVPSRASGPGTPSPR